MRFLFTVKNVSCGRKLFLIEFQYLKLHQKIYNTRYYFFSALRFFSSPVVLQLLDKTRQTQQLKSASAKCNLST